MARGKDERGRVAWREAELASLDLGRTFDAACCVRDVLNHLATEAAWLAALRGLARHLRPGGVLFVDVLSPAGLREVDVQSVQEWPDRTLILSAVYDGAERRSILKLTSFLRDGATGLFDRATSVISAWAQPFDALSQLLADAGFTAPEPAFSAASGEGADGRYMFWVTRR